MELRLAVPADLPQLKKVYSDICEEMRRSGVDLWNEQYPYEALPGDIAAKRLWLLCDGDIIAAAFALDSFTDTGDIRWEQPGAKAAVLMRLGVNVDYRRQNIGRKCCDLAGELAGKMGCTYIRLFVVDYNTPAVEFYIRCGFVRAPGAHREQVEGIEQGLIEYGFEKRT